MRKPLLFVALLFGIAALAVAGWRNDKIQFVDFQDANGHHVFALDKPVSRGDALVLRGSMFDVAKREALKGDNNSAFLQALSSGAPYTDSGCLQYVTVRSGGRAYFCGSCPGGAGCAQVKAIQ